MDYGQLLLKEILDAVLSFVDKPALFSCTTVNKAWFGSSCGLLWRRLGSLEHLFKLLSPTASQQCSYRPYPSGGATVRPVHYILKMFAEAF